MAHRFATEARAELDDIWYYLAAESGDLAFADRTVDAITDHFHLLASYPHLGRARDADLAPGLRSHPVGEYVIVYSIEGGDVIILHVLHGRRDIGGLLGS